MCSAVHLPVGVLVRNLAKLGRSGCEGSKFTAPSEMPGLTLGTKSPYEVKETDRKLNHVHMLLPFSLACSIFTVLISW